MPNRWRQYAHRVTGPQVAAVVQAVLRDGEAAKKISIAVPRALVEGLGC